MYDYVTAINQFLAWLRANPRVDLSYQDFEVDPLSFDPTWLEEMEEFMAEKYGAPFPLPAEDRQLIGFPRDFDISWSSTLDQPLAGGLIPYLTGCLNLCGLTTAFAEPTYKGLGRRYSPAYIEDVPLLRIATLFDCGSRDNVTNYLTYLLYDPVSRQYQGLAVEYGQRMLPLTVSIGEYVRAGLAWHGGWGWHLLYLSLEDFRTLDGSDLLTLYKLYDGLPELFPDVDWSIIDTKEAYFDIARPAAMHYRARQLRP